MLNSLPTGAAGRWLALGLAALLAIVLWVAVAAPLAAWYGARAEALTQRRILVQRMAQLAAERPAIEHDVAQAKSAGPSADAVLKQPSDAVAGAALQQRVQDMATRAGASLASAEALPAEAAGAYRRIRLRVALTARLPVLVGLLQAIGQATPRMLVDDLHLRAAPVLIGRGDPPLDATFVVLAFRAGRA